MSIPPDGYIATAAWTSAHPATARAFQHAIGQAQAVAATNRAVVEKLLPSFMPITKMIASTVNPEREAIVLAGVARKPVNGTAVAGEAAPSGYIDGPETLTCESQS